MKSAEARPLSVVIPTYREAENLAVLIPDLCGVLERESIEAEILIVDDNSPDDTAAICEQLATKYPVRLLIRTSERGLSSAVIFGIRHARGEIVLVMDADLSHPPEMVPALWAAVAGGAEFAIGSRYVAGGGTDEDWGLFRWVNSKVATLLAWPLTATKDPMSGFFALKRQTFVSAAQLNPIGYKIGLELMVKCGCRRIVEIPIHFANRLHGHSKLSLREQVRYLRHLGRLYQYKLGQTWLNGAVRRARRGGRCGG